MSAVLLNEVRAFVRRFVVLNDQEADVVALWCAHSHALEAAEATPYLSITSPDKRCGKSRLLEVLDMIVREPLMTVNISDAALFRVVDDKQPTLLMDEVDAIFRARDREELRGLLNAGHRRGAVAYRMGGSNNRTLESFAVFCAKAFTGIGDCLLDTIVDRAIPIRLKRRLPDEFVDRFRRREVEPTGHELRDRLADWLEPQLDYLVDLHPDLPDELDDRAADVWEPLLAIAELAGGDWPERARRAAGRLSGPEARADEEESKTAILLRDISFVFETTELEAFKTTDLLSHLHAIEESSWGDWYGKPLSAHGLSKLLRPYRIRTRTVYLGDGISGRGYNREMFEDAFLRVLGGRSGRSDRSDFPSYADSAASAASAAYPTGEPEWGEVDEAPPLLESEPTTPHNGELTFESRALLRQARSEVVHEKLAHEDEARNEECRRLEAEEVERLAELAREAQREA